MTVLVQSSFHTTWAGLFEMELEPNLLDWNVNELERKLELEDMKHTNYLIKSWPWLNELYFEHVRGADFQHAIS